MPFAQDPGIWLMAGREAFGNWLTDLIVGILVLLLLLLLYTEMTRSK